MNPLVRNIIVVIGGLLIGAMVNGGIIKLGMATIGYPEGLDPNAPGAWLSPLLELKHYIQPLLAHAIGTLVAAYLASKFSANKHFSCAMVVGLAFLAAGIAVNMMIAGPTWFRVVDIGLAYLPMAYLGWKLSGKDS